MKSEHSNQVIGDYQQHKLNICVMTRIQQLLIQFESDYAADRRWAYYGVVMLVGVAIAAALFFANSSTITIS